ASPSCRERRGIQGAKELQGMGGPARIRVDRDYPGPEEDGSWMRGTGTPL
ncbi:MAG: hypothetical protein GYA29_05125, partial [Methanothrix sp.]|nr:hypothetical protein [Methanothrix sp.]